MSLLIDQHPLLQQLKTDQDPRLNELVDKINVWHLNHQEFSIRLGKWLSNFEQPDYPLALKLLLNLDYYSEERLNETFERRLEALRRKGVYISGENRNAFLVLPDNKVDSAYRHNWLISKIEGIAGKEVLQVDGITPEIVGDNYLVFINDTHGSGDQFIRLIWRKLEVKGIKPDKVVILAIAVANAAHSRFAEAGFQVIPGDTARNANQVFNKEESSRIEALGKKINPTHPNGYGNTALLVAYHFQCPNSTLPLIWKTGDDTFPWNPLFPYLEKTFSGQVLSPVKPINPPQVSKALNNCQLSPARLTQGAAFLFGREAELEMINNAWENPATHVLTIVAFGGVGKTSLLIEWMAQRAASGWLGIDRVFEWSFYSQGTREQGDASSDQFIKAALIFFGDSEMAESSTSAWDKGVQLAKLVAEKPTLLILDGLEPLQYPPGPLAGKLKDPAIEILLKGLARNNAGLCVVTSRESLTDLIPYRENTAPERTLEFLNEEAGAQILHQAGVKRAGAADILPDDKELKDASRKVSGHALTLRLLGYYLALAENGDIRRLSTVKLEDADREYITNPVGADKAYGHAFKVMSAYEKWFNNEGKEGQRLVAVLRMLGLFDRPADVKCIDALRNPPAIPGLTKVLVDQGKAKWNITLSRLAACGLVLQPDNRTLDTHPLIREYFAKQLRDHNLGAWRAGHKRLYQYLTSSTKDKLKPTLEDLQPLYQAVAHGCQAGMHEKACLEVYNQRISKGLEAYVVKRLGAFGADLGAVACFFEQPWSRVSDSLPKIYHGWLLHQAGFRLRALGRLSEAVEPLRFAIDARIDESDWMAAAASAHTLSEVELDMGQITDAINDNKQSIEYADKSEKIFSQIVARASLGYALSCLGLHAEALESYREAEALEIEHHPDYPFLLSMSGIRYCDIILSEVERVCYSNRERDLQDRNLSLINYATSPIETIAPGDVLSEVEQWVGKAQSIKIERSEVTLLDSSYHHLLLGRTALCRAILTDSQSEKLDALESASRELDDAVNGFRCAGVMHHLPRGHISRAWCRYVTGDFSGAKDDLDAAWEIAERGPMRLHMADIHLHRARFFQDKEQLQKARVIIEECGYWKRKEDLENLDVILGIEN